MVTPSCGLVMGDFNDKIELKSPPGITSHFCKWLSSFVADFMKTKLTYVAIIYDYVLTRSSSHRKSRYTQMTSLNLQSEHSTTPLLRSPWNTVTLHSQLLLAQMCRSFSSNSSLFCIKKLGDRNWGVPQFWVSFCFLSSEVKFVQRGH